MLSPTGVNAAMAWTPVETTIDLAPDGARKRPMNAALFNSFGFGGTNAWLVFRAPN
jgi:3-oxoacyl-[acyl-carrier-protein] synthase II